MGIILDPLILVLALSSSTTSTHLSVSWIYGAKRYAQRCAGCSGYNHVNQYLLCPIPEPGILAYTAPKVSQSPQVPCFCLLLLISTLTCFVLGNSFVRLPKPWTDQNKRYHLQAKLGLGLLRGAGSAAFVLNKWPQKPLQVAEGPGVLCRKSGQFVTLVFFYCGLISFLYLDLSWMLRTADERKQWTQSATNSSLFPFLAWGGHLYWLSLSG